MTNNNDQQTKDSSGINANISVLPNVISSAMPLLTQIYNDLAAPGVKKIGQSLESVLDIAQTTLLPIKFWSEKKKITFQNNLEQYRKKIEKIDEEDIIDVSPEIGIPIIEKLTYTSNEELSKLFTNLLTKAASSQNVHLGHPGFIKIIESLSVDEAKIIQYFSNHVIGEGIDTIPHITLRAQKADKNGGADVYQYLSGIEYQTELIYPQNMQLYLDNLVSLGIIENHPNIPLADETRYEKVENKYDHLKEEIEQFMQEDKANLWESIETKQGYYLITNYGQTFIEACIK
ncbi:hypothetical protein IKI_05802 [Bacillus toyonensis]|uniref:DUF4393 domain-containing protein n=1 Tax=Bacillus toyonensis TaxID=155322 RepID=UPI000330B163|nr:DUF4393 domain-containing protein [Bacillus toyonensis]EOP35272.1 hypothetical protein IKI_05802 [Bacillus toyonensis]HDR7425730.1 DUF4393 domain-containing protein [Bacillus toyonensis]